MDKEVYEILKSFDITDLEIKDILNIAPMLENVSCDEFAMNCFLLKKYGYPDSDLDVLFLANPNVFVKDSKDLEDDLIKLKEQYDDIEMILKQNPMII